METLRWADEQLKKAKEDGMNVLPIGHHNLLAQSRMYTTQCAMNNNGDVIELFQKYELPLYLSGHLHVQRIRKHKAEPGAADDSYGIMEIVTDALSIPPCQYALLEWKPAQRQWMYRPGRRVLEARIRIFWILRVGRSAISRS